MYELALIAGGTIVGAAALFALLTMISRAAISDAEMASPQDSEKLAIARHRLGLIANRESIREARKIANKALRETS